MRDGRSQAGSLSYTYGRDLLLSLNQLTARPSPAVAERVRSLGLWAVCRLRTCGKLVTVGDGPGVVDDCCHGCVQPETAPPSSSALNVRRNTVTSAMSVRRRRWCVSTPIVIWALA